MKEKFHVNMNEDSEKNGLTPERKSVLDALKEGDFVLLSWNHDYVNKIGSSYPERPITELKKIPEEEAARM